MQQETVKQKKTANAPAVKQQNAVAIAEDFSAGGWDTEVIDTKDIIIPKILLMHPTSDLVKKGDRNQGEIIKSTSGEVVAKRNEKFDVIVFEKWKEWRIMKKNPQSGRFEYVRLEAWTPENDNNPWEYTENGETYRRDKTITGMKVADAYARALMDKQPPTRQVFKIGAELVNGKEETFFAFTAEPGEGTTPEMRAAALQWRQVVQTAKKNNAIVDHEVDEETSSSNTTSTDEF